MNKNILILAGLGVAAYFMLRKRRPDYSNLVSVESAEPISEQDFEQRRESSSNMTDVIRNVAQTGGNIIQRIREKRVESNRPVFLPGSSIPTGMTQRQLKQFIAKKKREEAKKKRQAARKQKRSDRATKKAGRSARVRRTRRQRKVGEINVLF